MENRNMEAVLQYINSNFVTVPDGDVKESNQILAKVLHEITFALKSVNVLFNFMFDTHVYGGSFFYGLKVSQPDEFDIDLKLQLPEILDVQLETSDRDGFVYLKLKDWKRLKSDPFLHVMYKDLEKLKDADNYLSNAKVKSWMQGIVQEAINKIREKGLFDDITLTPRMSGPAVTLNVTHKNRCLHIALVAVFRIPGSEWPEFPVRQNVNIRWEDFLVVPKPPKDAPQHPERYWRLSFPEQEREMIKKLKFCKPAIRLLKKLRDTRSHKIPSYFIKTIFLWEIEKRENNDDTGFWNTSLTNVFMQMLIKYKNYLELHDIPYFWDVHNNFLQFVSPFIVSNIQNYLDGMIKNIETRRDTDRFIVARYLLKPDELNKVENYFRDRPAGGNSIPRPIISMSEPRGAPIPSGLMQEPRPQDTGISTGTMIAGAAAVGIGAAILGLFALSRNRRNE